MNTKKFRPRNFASWSVNCAKWIILPTAFAPMFSTTITCLDACQSKPSIQGLLRGTDFGHMDSNENEIDFNFGW